MALENNLARDLHSVMPEKAPQVQPQRPQQRPAYTPEPKKHGLSKIEKILITIASMIIFSLGVACISLEIMVATSNREVQDTNREIEEIAVVNTNLEQEVQELSRYDRVYQIAKAYGLEMNEENVRNVSK
ncbi:cell division protein FtsL [Desemzia sp. RIT804]|uniref:cell division protein FtsL n=1 Tax=Desemzia sp. RIT 804 TaxID=2810209 RepID=UPI00194F4B29|nr:cell division protein FtsL [Desemzia sp. RIT 804]MBM6613500.1 cell division protein FtsL [Desemzia sp. RIT 804]